MCVRLCMCLYVACTCTQGQAVTHHFPLHSMYVCYIHTHTHTRTHTHTHTRSDDAPMEMDVQVIMYVCYMHTHTHTHTQQRRASGNGRTCDYVRTLYTNTHKHTHKHTPTQTHTQTHTHTHSDDAPVDMDALVSKIMHYQNGLIVAEQEPEEVLECCPTCRSCGLLPHEVALVTPLTEYEIL